VWHFNCCLVSGMANDFEQLLRDVFGEPLNKLNQFQADQVKKLQTRLQELAREAVRDELTKLHAEITEIRNRVAILEAERVRAAAESVESSF
jgi:uncharacterized protein YPO0396